MDRPRTRYSGRCCVASSLLLVLAALAMVPAVAAAGAWSIGWRYRKQITIDHTKVRDDFSDFPVLIDLPLDTDLADKARSDGADILFTNDSGTRLNHEIEYFDGATGEFVAWVNVTSLSSTIDTIVYMYYGNPDSVNQENPEGAWSSSYEGVWHLHDDFLDSTVNHNDATNHGSVDALGWVTDGQHFDGTDDYLDAPDHCLGANSDWTASCWFKADSTSGSSYHYMMSTGDWGGPDTVQIWQDIATGKVAVRLIDSDGEDLNLWGLEGGGDYLDDEWHLLHAVWDASSHHVYLYIDGSLDRDGTNSNVDTGSGMTNELCMAARQDHYSRRFLLGELDEVRISTSAKTGGWIETEYDNQRDPASFYGVGSEKENTVPALTEWGTLILMTMITGIGAMILRKRRTA